MLEMTCVWMECRNEASVRQFGTQAVNPVRRSR